MHLLNIWMFLSLLLVNTPSSQLVVAKDQSGHFTNIQSAIDSAFINKNIRKIKIKAGEYREKVTIDSTICFLTIEGENRDEVIIISTIARDIWRCQHMDDYGAATINVKGSDLTFRNLTVINDYGLLTDKSIEIPCPNRFDPGKLTDSDSSVLRTVKPDCHQFAFRSMPGSTRLQFYNCTFISGGGDTVSPWDVDKGLFYFKDCKIEGHVDSYCPRGYSLAEDCTFICHNKSACIWHDGSADENAKSVLKNCHFQGVKGFVLGRFHKDSQQYLIDCTFSDAMADKAIYRSPSSNILKYGDRIFYVNCTKDGSPFDWYKTNVNLNSEDVNFEWVFGDKWKISSPLETE